MKTIDNDKKTELLFNTSIALLATALTIVSVIEINKNELLFFLDELFVVEAFLFSIVVFITYVNMYVTKHPVMEKAANFIFLSGLAGMLIGSLLLTFNP